MLYSNSVFTEDKREAMVIRIVHKKTNSPYKIAGGARYFKTAESNHYYSKRGITYKAGALAIFQPAKILEKIKSALTITTIGSIILTTIVLSIIILFAFFGNGNFIANPVIG